MANGWRQLLASYRASSQTLHVYVNDVLDTLDYSAMNTGAIDWTQSNWALGALVSASQLFNGDMAEIWLDDSYSDLSVENNRRKLRAVYYRRAAA